MAAPRSSRPGRSAARQVASLLRASAEARCDRASRHSVLVPVARVPRHLDGCSRHLGDAERSGARRRRGEFLPVLAGGLVGRGAGDQEGRHHLREVARRLLGEDRDLVLVDLLPPVDDAEPNAREGCRVLLVVRRILVEEPLEVPDHRVGGEFRAIVKLHALPQREDPTLSVGRIALEALGEPWDDGRHRLGHTQIPANQRLEGRKARETKALEALVRRSGRRRHVGSRHRDAQDLLRSSARSGNPARPERSSREKAPSVPCEAPLTAGEPLTIAIAAVSGKSPLDGGNRRAISMRRLSGTDRGKRGRVCSCGVID